MKSRKLLIIVPVLLVLAVVLCLLLREGEALNPTVQQPKAVPTRATSPEHLTTTAPRQEPGGPYAPADPRWSERRQRLKADPQYEWKTPIEFYGKVVDQDGNPVSGAIADVIWTTLSTKGSSSMTETSDSAGLFSIRGIKGKHMTVQVNKAGYYRQLTDTKSTFEYTGFWEPTYHIPDKNNPVVFRLKKKGEAAALLHYGPTLFGAKPDGTPSVFDLATGRKSNGAGDVSVSVRKGAKGADRQFDWDVKIEAVGAGAGLLESKDEFMVEAPQEGYQPNWSFTQRAGTEGFQSEMQAKFFVRTAEGKFARIEVRVLPEYSDLAAVDLVSYFNPVPGSRNLEFDSSKAIRPR